MREQRYLPLNIVSIHLHCYPALHVLAGNRIVEFPELVDLMARRPWGHQGSEQELSHAFQLFDHEKDGRVSLTEMRHLLTQMGENLTDAEVGDFQTYMCEDHDSDYEDVVVMMMMTMMMMMMPVLV